LDKLVSGSGLGATASKPLKHHDFRPDINGLRALAVLSVLAFHAELPVPGGFVGVDIFFVISGFLITRIILSERGAEAFSLAGFYGKRVKRILPALLLVLFASWGLGWFLLDPDDFRRFGGHMEGSSYFSVNLWLYRQSFGPAAYFNPAARYMPALHLWSLSIEEQFYLIWPALMLGLFKLRRVLFAPAIGAIFLASLAFSIFITIRDPNGGFFFLSSRAWELALGALLAQRTVFVNPPPPTPGAANFRAGLGIAMMVASLWLFLESTPWPGFAALVPTIGCALVISAPGARISEILLGNRVAQFFGLISYPLYLWHWPLLSIAHNRFGDHLPHWLVALLLGLSVLLSWLTWRFVEGPVAKLYSRKPLAAALPLLAGLALAGALGSVTRQQNGFPQRLPPEVNAVLDYRAVANNDLSANSTCGEGDIFHFGTPSDLRAKAHAFFTKNACLTIKHPYRPTVVLLGDSHAMHLVRGLREVYGDRVNFVIMGAGGCAPLIVDGWQIGMVGSPRCRAINYEAFLNIVALKPTAVIIAAYYSEFYNGVFRFYPGFLNDLDSNIGALRQAGVQSPILVMGQVPVWSPSVPSLVGRELLAGKKPSEFTHDNVNPESLELDKRFATHPWGENVFYVSQAAKLCGEDGCRRMVGPHAPQDMISMDYGHYTPAGSVYAVRNILAPALDPILAAAKPH
jgi:peptidoglycan/LPS O-acetylase OafA/YrhL